MPKSTGDSTVKCTTANVTAFTLEMDAGGCPLDIARKAGRHDRWPEGDRAGARCRPLLERALPQDPASRWTAGRGRAADRSCTNATACRARSTTPFWTASFSSSPTGTPLAPGVAQWATAEEKRAIAEWRRQFRGEAQVRDDTAVTDADIAASNLVLWGDPGSNQVLARIADRLPVRWTARMRSVWGTRDFRGHARPSADLSESAESQKVRGGQQRLHVPRIRLSEQCAADSQAAGLRGDRHNHAARRPMARQGGDWPASSASGGSCRRNWGNSESTRQEHAEPGLWLEDIPEPKIGINDVLIRVQRAGRLRHRRSHLQLGRMGAADHSRAHGDRPRIRRRDRRGRIQRHRFPRGRSGQRRRVTWSAAAAATAWRAGGISARTSRGVGVNRAGAFADYIAMPVTNLWRAQARHRSGRRRDFRSLRQCRAHRAFVSRAGRGCADHRRRAHRNHGCRRGRVTRPRGSW